MNSSDLTQRRLERLLYSSFLAQRNRINGGCGSTPRLENGQNHGAGSIPLLAEGSLFTTSAEYNTILASSSCAAPAATGKGIYMVGQFQTDPISFYGAQEPVAVQLHTANNGSNWASFLVKYDGNGTPLWTARVGAIVADESGNGAGTDVPNVCVSADGSVYVFGNAWFSSTQNNYIYVYSASADLPAVSMPVTDVYAGTWLAKYNSDGQVLWATFMRSENNTSRPFVVADSSNNVYVQLHKSGGNTYVYSAGNTDDVNANLVSLTDTDVFVIKYNSDGQFQWYSLVSSATNENVTGMACDASDNLYVGITRYDAVDLNVYTNSNMDSPTFLLGGGDAGQWYYSILKYNTANGGIIWGTNIGGVDASNPMSMSTDSSLNLYVAFSYWIGAVNIYNSDDQNNVALSIPARTESTNTGLVKYNQDGIAQWATSVSGADGAEQPCIGVDSTDNVLLVGRSSSDAVDVYNSDSTFNTLTFTLPDTKLFLVKFNPAGISQWSSFVGPFSYVSSDFDMKIDTEDDSIAISGMIGQFTIQMYNTAGSSVLTLENTTQNDVCFLVKYNTDGTPVWRAYNEGQAQPQLAI